MEVADKADVVPPSQIDNRALTRCGGRHGQAQFVQSRVDEHSWPSMNSIRTCSNMIDGQELWRAQVSVLWPHEMSVDALAPSKRESLLMAKARVCSTLQEPPHEAAGELCPSRASSNDVVTLPGTPGQVGTLVSPEPPADQLPGTQTQKTLVEKGHVDKHLSPTTASDQEVRLQKNHWIAPTIVANAPQLPDDEIEEEAAGDNVVSEHAGSEKIVHDIITGRRLMLLIDFNHWIDCTLMAKIEKS
ncbi:hypothetical protein HPB49_014526 [Dermacentor silvarum]|uniref:Uncharacterized protein n=1 Tax=Dermacentor silvarum TaxID=543639 RepID=A0ACB8E0Y5_DERSI|nr:hypothetical protein HPB49_014526 [Dermacentor silvarum]